MWEPYPYPVPVVIVTTRRRVSAKKAQKIRERIEKYGLAFLPLGSHVRDVIR